MVLHFLKDRLILLLSQEEYLTVLAPATGVVLAISVKAICKYQQHQKRFNNKIFKFNKPIKTPIYNPIRGIVLKTSYVHGKIILICSKLNRIILLILYKLPVDLEMWTKGIWVVTELVIVSRAIRILFDVSKYLLKNKTNVLKTAVNTLIWIVNDETRTLIYKLVFIGVSLSTALMWTYVPMLRRILRVWTTITMFNLCSNIVVTDGRQLWLEHGPQATAFGLRLPPIERLERPIRELKTNAEQLKSLTITLPGNETELILSSPSRNEMRSTLSKEARIRLKEDTTIVLHEKTLIGTKEETPIVTKEETLIGTKEETPIVTKEETPIVINDEATIVTNDEATIVTNDEATIVTNDETPIVTNDETPIVTNDEATIVRNEEAMIVPKEELRKTNSTSKIKQTMQKSRTNNLQKLNEKFNPPGDNITPRDNDDNLETNYTKVREGKVR